jgi:hypothetical protein
VTLFLVAHIIYSKLSVFTILMHASLCEFQLDEHVVGHVRVSSSSVPHRTNWDVPTGCRYGRRSVKSWITFLHPSLKPVGSCTIFHPQGPRRKGSGGLLSNTLLDYSITTSSTQYIIVNKIYASTSIK